MTAPLPSVAPYFSTPERVAALQIGARVITEHFPIKVQVPIQVRRDVSSLDATAALHLPGIVRVTLRYTGDLIAQSKPGKLFELDPSAV